ncbi:Pr6Pr family membrane protein [Microbacterium sp. 1.5R]|uniref:Pr6Pr family membrane protein n=1 Tax=Microbacterium sp. 1.5R TaxID=1916917 RepID=UPI0011A98239|nr:Pr6Pr family membrane protein [Microbacterium sp. 1.5R]
MSKAVVTPPAASDLPAVEPHAPLLADAAIGWRPLALAYRLIAVTLIATGVARNAGIVDGTFDATTLLYYTMVSNLICLGWMLVLVARTTGDLRGSGTRGTSTPSARLSGAVMMAITVTMLIYLVVLVPTRVTAGDTDIFSLTDTLVHVATPALLIADWLLFVPKGAFRWTDPLAWILVPYAYLVWAFVYGALGGEFVPGQRYPYPFMDVGALGIPGVTQWVVALTIALVAVGFVFVVIDRLLARVAGRQRAERDHTRLS